MKHIPPFSLVAQPLNDEAENLLPFKWASSEVGKRDKLGLPALRLEAFDADLERHDLAIQGDTKQIYHLIARPSTDKVRHNSDKNVSVVSNSIETMPVVTNFRQTGKTLMLTPIEHMQGDSKKDTRLLGKMAEEAANYITSFAWCPPIKSEYFAFGIGKIIALFLFEFDGKIDGTYSNSWVVVGDLPPCFFAVQPDDTVQLLLEDYCARMDDWVAAVRNNGSFEEVFPVSAARTQEHADMLASRLAFLRKEIIPEAPADLMSDANGALIIAN